MVKRTFVSKQTSTGASDDEFSVDDDDDDGIFQDALEERSIVPKKPRNKLQRQPSGTVEILEDLSFSPLDASSFLTPRTYPQCPIDPLLQPLDTLETQGIQVYFDWLSSSSIIQRPTAKAKDAEQLVIDATISGDPREYQRLLLETALTQNTIVHLGTGYGKTLIALLLIKEKSPEWGLDKQAVFLVPSVALAIQQTLSLRANLPYTVETACYDTTNSEERRQKLHKAQILVATHGALLDLLMHYSDRFSMRRFNVLVIDECHYCAGNHTYAIIMKKYYHALAKDERPHVLGLTASPLVNLRDAHSDQELESMLQTLEVTMDAHLVSAEHLIPEVYRKRVAVESVIDYDGSQRRPPSADNLPLHHSRFREFRQLEQLYQDLGPLPVSLYCQALLRELARNEFENETPQQYHTALHHLKSMIQFCDQECHSFSNHGRTDKLVALEQILESEIENHGGAGTVGLVFTDRRVTAVALHSYFRWREANREDAKEQAKYSWGQAAELRQQSPVSSKIIPPVQTVNDIFADSNDDPFLEFQKPNVPEPTDHVSQFMDAEDDENVVENKPSPLTFVDTGNVPSTLPPPPPPRTSIRSAVLVRNITSIFNSLSFEKASTDISEETARAWLHVDQKIRNVLTMLRRKEFNLLFATSVVEEGVDVQACSVVIAFDSIRTTKSYVQMKGRARKAGAKFFVFEDRLDKNNKSILPLPRAQAMEQRLQDFIIMKAKQESLEMATKEASMEDLTSEPEIAALRQGFFKAENGIVDLQSAKSLLNRYSISVPLDPFVRFSREALIAHMPDFRENTLILPSHLRKDIRKVILPDEFRSHTLAEKRKMLSLMACVRLHNHGLLNHRLLPLTRQDMHNKIRLATATRMVEIKPLQLPLERFFDDHDSQTIYLHCIHHESEGYSKVETILRGEGHYLGLITFEKLTEAVPPFVMHHKEFGLVTTTLGTSTEVICTRGQINLLRQVFILLMNERWRRHSRSMFFKFRAAENYRAAFLPYLVGIVCSEGRLDWALMEELLTESQRTRQQRQDVVTSLSSSNPLPKPRLWTSVKDAHTAYIAFGPAHETVLAEFPGEKQGVETYQDYFSKYRGIETRSDDQLFDVQRFWTQPSTFVRTALSTPTFVPRVKTSGAIYDMCPELPAVKVPQSACIEAPIANAHIGLLTCFLPQVLFVFERSMNARALVTFCRDNLPRLGSCLSQLSLEAVATAMTSKSCGMDVSYEKMEWFGDAVLKMVQTESLLKSVELKGWIEFLHEGDLSMLRQEMGCNKKLVQVCRQFGLERYILSASLARGMWLPSCLDFSSETIGPKKLEAGDKMLADILESLLGLVYLEFDYQTAMAVADELTVTVNWEEPKLEEASERVQVDATLLKSVIRATGYSGFSRPELVEEAFSHPTARNPEVPSFERLEWVGDAVLCLSTREWIWKNFPDLELSEMVTMESALVSNEVLSFLSVQTGLHRYLSHKDHTLPSRIEAYIYSIQEDGCGLWGTDPPKSIADIIESLCGAIYTDSDLSQGLAAVRNILRPMSDALLTLKRENQTIRLMHPKKALQEMMGEIFHLETSWETDFAKQQGSTNVLEGNRWRQADPSSPNVVAYIHWMDVVFVAVSDASAVIARNKACAIAVQTLQHHPDVYARLQDLRSKMENSLSVNSSVKKPSPQGSAQ